ncbi:MAG: LysR family transcriptional regulator [Pyramidobacter sp.]|uniref:LysR substrate-binding domain-containing protein n=1 Tax=Pyramidobacter sp. TaxID=1943581 RepID=UPI002A835818|nr:LysR family transcriptional regulator [Pyramidobacter sp.]MDY4031519.1 LysR family transcriptional regulator [Pyramidobacter sp.]
MTTAQEMFLLAAQELSFSRAAKRAFVTPQCLSDHIRRLEERYGVKLFHRRPRLELTREGRTLLDYLSRIAQLEENMALEMKDVSAGMRGTVRLGIPLTRGRIFIPRIMPQFQRCFPRVDVKIALRDTRDLQKMTVEGKLDLFVGVGAEHSPLFQFAPIAEEPLYLVVPEPQLSRAFPDCDESTVAELRRSGADLTPFADVPFVQGNDMSTTTLLVRELWQKSGLKPNLHVEVSNFDIMLDLCRQCGCATICSRGQLYRLKEQKRREKPGERLRVFPLRDKNRLAVELVTPRSARPAKFISALGQMLVEVMKSEDAALDQWLRADEPGTKAEKTALRQE